MKFGTKSISIRIGIFYLLLALLNMSIFSLMVYENQIDLIMENTKYKVKELTGNIISSLNKTSIGMVKIEKENIAVWEEK